MLYPEFIKKGDTIGICAPSAGVGHKLAEYEESLSVLHRRGYEILETSSVRRDNVRSASARKRAAEMHELIVNKDVRHVMCAAGGDYMLEMMPYVDLEKIRENPKWFSGMSDPTNILYTITCALDIATIYGFNAGGFSLKEDRMQEDFLDYLKGDIRTQRSYRRYQTFLESKENSDVWHPVRWEASFEGEIRGRLIGGCIESIEKIIGSSLDHTAEFLDRYRQDGIIWYFDVFDMSAYNFYLTLLQFKNAGWFDDCKGVLVGRVCFPRVEDPKLDYVKALKKALGRIPYIAEMDIGHTHPHLTMINGALVRVRQRDGRGSIAFSLK